MSEGQRNPQDHPDSVRVADIHYDDEEDSDEGTARNLLEIKGNVDNSGNFQNAFQKGNRATSNIQRPVSNCEIPNHQSQGCAVSITQLFEPKFIEVFDAYKDHLRIVKGSCAIDLSQHLMSLCLDHLVPFSCWARESNARCAWIQKTLDDNIDLRPEVRNGLCMVFVYSFSAAKALDGSGENDMFLVLQEPDTGLGIVNKTSLKIYNDPFCFFSFLKACMSGLIDAGKLPENERLNQPKKSKRQLELGEELGAYLQMKNGLVAMFNRGDNELVREKVRQILAVWQYRAKSIRNRRFATALSVLTNSTQSNFLTPDLMSMGQGMMMMNSYAPMSVIQEAPKPSTGCGCPSDTKSYADQSYQRQYETKIVYDRKNPSINKPTIPSKDSGLMSLVTLSSAASWRAHTVKNKTAPQIASRNPAQSTHNYPYTLSSSSGEEPPYNHADFPVSKNSSDDESNHRNLASLTDAAELTLGSNNECGKGRKRLHTDIEAQESPASAPSLTFPGSRVAPKGFKQQPQHEKKFNIDFAALPPVLQVISGQQTERPAEIDAFRAAPCWSHFNENDFITSPEEDCVSTDTSKDGGVKGGCARKKKLIKTSISEDETAATATKTSKCACSKPESAATRDVLERDPSHCGVSSLPALPSTVASGFGMEDSKEISSPHLTASSRNNSCDFTSIQGTMQMQVQPQAKPLPPKQHCNMAIKSIRCERVGAAEWEMKESRIFNIDSLLASTDCVISLVDESKFTSEEINDLVLTSRTNGFVNLQSELQQRRALIASWPKAEHPNLLDFMNEWKKAENSDLSLIKMWESSAKKSAGGSGRTSCGGSNGRPAAPEKVAAAQSTGGGCCGSAPKTGCGRSEETVAVSKEEMVPVVGTGVIVYEVVMKVGFIVRTSSSLNIKEDCWRVLYPKDLLSNSFQVPFATFLGILFPQLRSLLGKLENLDECIVKYCAHTGSNEKLSQPPESLGSGCYQTIGTINETASSIVGRLDASLVIHDFVLQL